MAVVLITGSNSGLGLQATLALARAGHRVYACVREISRATKLQDAIGREALDVNIRLLDIGQPESFDQLIRSIVDEAKSLDVLVNNAGIIRPGACEDLSETAIREVMETNFFGPMLLARAVLPQMRAQKRGKIIMVSSLSGVAGLAGDVFYSASKFALEGATEALRHEISRWGIHVALIEAGQYATSLFDSGFGHESLLPLDYPLESPYREMVQARQQSIRQNMQDAMDPAVVGQLMLKIVESDGSQLRWPADELSRNVMTRLFGQSDAERDAFLRKAASIDWWIAGLDEPDSVKK